MNVAGAALLALLTASGTIACDRTAVETWLKEGQTADPGPSLWLKVPLSGAVRSFHDRLGQDIRALSLLVYTDHAVLQAQNPRDPGKVDQWVYRRGVVGDPVPVQLLGKGKLEDNLFRLEDAKLDALPTLVEEARKRVDIPEGVVARVLLKRNLPETSDVRFRVFISSERRDAFVDADARGQLLEPQMPVTRP